MDTSPRHSAAPVATSAASHRVNTRGNQTGTSRANDVAMMTWTATTVAMVHSVGYGS
jgi:hypothetical protein